jgi:hypothetical protein
MALTSDEQACGRHAHMTPALRRLGAYGSDKGRFNFTNNRRPPFMKIGEKRAVEAPLHRRRVFAAKRISIVASTIIFTGIESVFLGSLIQSARQMKARLNEDFCMKFL